MQQILIDFNLPIAAIVFFAVAFVALIYILTVYGYRLRVVRKRRRDSDAECIAQDESVEGALVKASVVVCVNDDADVLECTLPPILNQQYPGTYEVIVVNEAPSNEVSTLVTRLKSQYSNLYLTFTPDSSRNVSQKKLAITLGVKAARGEVIVLVDATTMVPGERWLERMVRPFNDSNVEVVIGYNTPYFTEEGWSGRLVKAYDVAVDDVAWLSTAIKGKPYRACGNNVAYRRSKFFSNKGFSGSLNMSNGDDDLFINEIATRDNTVVELSYESLGTWGSEHGMAKRMGRYRLSHAFTGRQLPRYSRAVLALGSWMMWLVVVASLIGVWFAGIYNAVGWGIAAVLILAMIIAIIVMWRKTISIMGGPKLLFTLPIFTALRPLRNIKLNMRAGASKNANYTWERGS